MTVIIAIFLMLLIFYIYNCLDNWILWFKYERDLPIKYQNHRKWWKL